MMAWVAARFRAIRALRPWSFAAFMLGPMERGDKRVKLRTVDDEVAREPDVVRLYNRESEPRRQLEPVVRLGKQTSKEAPSRLEMTSREELELRTHQPGIEVLIEPDAYNPDLAEQAWGETPDKRHPVPWAWFLLLGLAVITAVVWSLVNLKESEVVAHSIRDETKSKLASEEVEETEAHELIERIEDTLRIYFETSSVDLLARLVRHPERVKPLMRDHYARQPLVASPMKSLRSLQPLTLDHQGNFWIGSVMLADDRSVNLVMEIGRDGQPRIDWETQVCYQPMLWDDFARQRPADKSMDFRVYAERDNFHSHEFADSENWLSFRLTTLDAEETLFGYVSVGSEAANQLLEITQRNPNVRNSMILRLSIPHGLHSRRGVVIEKVICSRWLYLDSPDTGS